MVECGADLDQGFVRCVEGRIEGDRPLPEELDCRSRGKRAERITTLGTEVERLTARDDHAQARAALNEPPHLLAGLGNLLEVVQHEDGAFPGDLVDGVCRRTNGGGDGRLDERRIAQRRKVDEPDAVECIRCDLFGDLHCEPGLAHAARAGDRDEPRALGAQQAQHVRQFLVPPHERARLRGQICLVERAQWCKLLLAELEETDGTSEVLEPVLTKVAQVGRNEVARRL
jgi:hypothetical protein